MSHLSAKTYSRRPARPSTRRRRSGLTSGFTLIEAALVTTIISVGVVALLQLLATGTVTNTSSTEITTGLHLAKSVREMMFGMRYCDENVPLNFGPESGESLATYDDVDDFNGAVLNPPRDARRAQVANMSGWEQRVFVQKVDEDCLTLILPNSVISPAARVTVKVFHHGKEVADARWYVFDTTE